MAFLVPLMYWASFQKYSRNQINLSPFYQFFLDALCSALSQSAILWMVLSYVLSKIGLKLRPSSIYTTD